jgi:hypothetical protein
MSTDQTFEVKMEETKETPPLEYIQKVVDFAAENPNFSIKTISNRFKMCKTYSELSRYRDCEKSRN